MPVIVVVSEKGAGSDWSTSSWVSSMGVEMVSEAVAATVASAVPVHISSPPRFSEEGTGSNGNEDKRPMTGGGADL